MNPFPVNSISVTWFVGNESIHLPLNCETCTNTQKSVVGVMLTYEFSYHCFSTGFGIGESDGHVCAINLHIERGGVSTFEILTKREVSIGLSL